MQSNYKRVLANTLVEEGGYSDHPSDPGGPTMRGVIQRVYDAYRRRRGLSPRHVRQIEEHELQEIYAEGYWMPIRGPEWPKGVDQIAFDICVNSGSGNATRIMAKALGSSGGASLLAQTARLAPDHVQVVKKACAQRLSFYHGIKHKAAFITGWTRRNARMEAIGVKMVLEAKQVAEPEIVLRQEEVTAKKQETKAKAGAGTTAAGQATAGGDAASGGQISGQVLEPAGWGWPEWLLVVALVLASLAALGYFLWWWRVHRERVKAYAEAQLGTLEVGLARVLEAMKE